MIESSSMIAHHKSASPYNRFVRHNRIGLCSGKIANNRSPASTRKAEVNQKSGCARKKRCAHERKDVRVKQRAAFYCRLSLCESSVHQHFRGAKSDTNFPTNAKRKDVRVKEKTHEKARSNAHAAFGSPGWHGGQHLSAAGCCLHCEANKIG